MSSPLDEIRNQRVDIKHALQGNPFDPHFDFHGKLKPEFFFDQIHVKSDEHEALKLKLYTTLTSQIASDKIIFINGFPGNGKTTFLRSFEHHYKDEFNHVFINVENKTTRSSANKDIEEEVLDLIKSTIRNQVIGKITPSKTLGFLAKNKDTLYEKDHISDHFYSKLESLADYEEYSPKELKLILNSLDFLDTFTFLFVHLILNREKRESIVYIDNLDVASNEYLSRKFLSAFQDSIDNAVALTRLPIFENFECNFLRDFRFLLCLRDANDAYVTSHKTSRLNIRQLPFRIEFDAKFYEDILSKKIDFVKRLFNDDEIDEDGITVSAIEDVLKRLQNDDYFKWIFIPLYNYDYRKLIVNCLSVIVNHRIFDLDQPGIRGVFVHGIVGNLIENNFIKTYFNKTMDKEIGYCYEERVLITVISNINNYYVRDQEDEKSDSVGLYTLINRLHKVMPIDRALDAISNCFLFHRRDWVNLLTVLNFQIKEKHNLREEFSLQVKDCLLLERSDEKTVCRTEINQIRVRLNPSGYVYIRHILPHFEFYSHIVGVNKSLYQDVLERAVLPYKSGNVYEFENKIDKVIQRVKVHLESMDNYFTGKYETSGLTRHKFSKSDFSFRYYGNSDRNKFTGYFHSSRICSFHIGYLDNFRKFVLAKSDMDLPTKIDINKRIVTRMKYYIDSLINSYDRKAIHDYGNGFKLCLDEIIKSDFQDLSLEISKTQGKILENKE